MSDAVQPQLVTAHPAAAGEQRFRDGSRRVRVALPSVTIGRGVYEPGWRWSAHARPPTGRDAQAHVGYIVCGHMAVRAADGTVAELGPGDAFEVAPGHDAWVLGDEPCEALDFAAAAP